ncbi:tigger transposable element-derived protein 4-like [Dreissena polymorpha]|uniref:tigger transposable element-derived protein 4-like n=1 Tax=Dreissena polymorpha TaxID=45954 RepID=UPI002264FDF1|nr:tigger transposable element-derived protein 4-like [Dreissena polymorpha]
MKKISGEANSVDKTDAAYTMWQSRLQTILETYTADDIFNADETAIFYRALPEKTLEFKSIACHGGKASKERLSVMVCANMSGTEKLPLLIIGKSLKPRCFRSIHHLPTTYRANKKAWMTSHVFTEWLRTLDEKMFRKRRKIAMIVDNCPAHPDVSDLKAIRLVFLPPNTTSITQPMDQGVIKNLKIHYRKRVVSKKLVAIENNNTVVITVLDAMFMLREAWDRVTPATIAYCYKHAGFSADPTAINELDSDQEDPEDDIPLAQLILAYGSSVNISEFVDFDRDLTSTESLTDSDIISDVINSKTAPTDESDEDDKDPAPVPVTASEALKACDLIRRYLQQISWHSDGQRKAADVELIVQRQFLQSVCSKQKGITEFFKPVSRSGDVE